MKLYIHNSQPTYSTTFLPGWLPVEMKEDQLFLLLTGEKLVDYTATRKMKGDQLVLKPLSKKRREALKPLSHRVKSLEAQIKKLQKESKK